MQPAMGFRVSHAPSTVLHWIDRHRREKGFITSAQAQDPLHGVTLAMLLERLVAHYGWDELGARIPIRCFTLDPSLKSSLTFLRKTPWAREKVEALYLSCHKHIKPPDGPGS